MVLKVMPNYFTPKGGIKKKGVSLKFPWEGTRGQRNLESDKLANLVPQTLATRLTALAVFTLAL